MSPKIFLAHFETEEQGDSVETFSLVVSASNVNAALTKFAEFIWSKRNKGELFLHSQRIYIEVIYRLDGVIVDPALTYYNRRIVGEEGRSSVVFSELGTNAIEGFDWYPDGATYDESTQHAFIEFEKEND